MAESEGRYRHDRSEAILLVDADQQYRLDWAAQSAQRPPQWLQPTSSNQQQTRKSLIGLLFALEVETIRRRQESCCVQSASIESIAPSNLQSVLELLIATIVICKMMTVLELLMMEQGVATMKAGSAR